MPPKNFQKIKLKNGITVTHEYRSLPVVALSITNRFGAAYEESKIKGIAHFIEHLVFTGTKTRTHEDISREIEKRGGILNAFTSHDVTSFWFKLPSEHIFAGLDILTDILNNPVFNPEKFEKEKKVIIEEIKMYHDMPMRDIGDKFEANLYQNPFGESVIGSEKTVSTLQRDFVASYFKKSYNPSNYIVTIVGNADLKKVCAYLEKNFAPNQFSHKIIPIKKHNRETTEKRKGIDQAHFMFGFHAPFRNDKLSFALEILNAHLADGMSSKLFLKIREERGLAYTVRGSLSTEKNYSYYGIYVGTTKEAIPEVKKIILDEFGKIKNMNEKDLAEAKERLIGLRKLATEESADVMNELMCEELIDKAENYYEHEQKINAVTLKEVRELAKFSGFSTAAIVPE